MFRSSRRRGAVLPRGGEGQHTCRLSQTTDVTPSQLADHFAYLLNITGWVAASEHEIYGCGVAYLRYQVLGTHDGPALHSGVKNQSSRGSRCQVKPLYQARLVVPSMSS